MKIDRWGKSFLLLVTLLVGFPVEAGVIYTAPLECYSAPVTPAPQQSGARGYVWIVPSMPGAGETITVCGTGFDWPYKPNLSSVVRNGSQITATVFVTGITSNPNPPLMVGTAIGSLPAGSYSVDLFNDVGNNPNPGVFFPYLVGSAAFDVAPQEPTGIPALGFGSLALLAALVVIGAAVTRRHARR